MISEDETKRDQFFIEFVSVEVCQINIKLIQIIFESIDCFDIDINVLLRFDQFDKIV